jgi:transcription antitermination factor NusG
VVFPDSIHGRDISEANFSVGRKAGKRLANGSPTNQYLRDSPMPALAAETSLFPENLFADSLCLPTELEQDFDQQWWVMRTKSRQEKSLARDLLAREIPFYLPLAKKIAKVRGRRVSSYHPFFPGYVFLYANETHRVQSLTTNRVVQILPVLNQEKLWFDLSQVHRLIESNAELSFEPRLELGQRVRINHGSMMGLEGTLLHRRGETKFLVAIDFLQQGASLEIDDSQLEVLEV